MAWLLGVNDDYCECLINIIIFFIILNYIY